MSDEFDEDVDFEEPPHRVTKKRPLWLIVGAFFELISNILRAFTGFFDIAADASLQKFTYQNERERFIQQASQEIEMLVSGVHDATTSSTGTGLGTGASESPN